MATAVLLSYHGTVSRAADIPAFVRNIRRGHEPPAEVVDEVIRRFERIGGSPLRRISERQASALEARLGVPVRAAGRLWHPYPDEVLAELASAGARTVISLPLAPQSVHVYHAAVERAAANHGLEVLRSPAWGLEPALIDAFCGAIEEAAARLTSNASGVGVVLSAHSLPVRVIAAGDGYERDFRAMAAAVTAELARRHFDPSRVRVAFQSQGMGDSQPWLGPSLDEVLSDLREHADELVIAPIGFLAEHVETLYDIDVEARELATKLGFSRVERMPALDDRPRLIDALEGVARRLLPTMTEPTA